VIQPKRVNEAIDKGWRLREAGPPGCWVIVPPEAYEADLGLSVKGANVFKLMVPSEDLEDWLKAREQHEPQDLRHSNHAEIVTWFKTEWPGYLEECEDEDYAKELIVEDASVDFEMQEDTELLKTWLKQALEQ